MMSRPIMSRKPRTALTGSPLGERTVTGMPKNARNMRLEPSTNIQSAAIPGSYGTSPPGGAPAGSTGWIQRVASDGCGGRLFRDSSLGGRGLDRQVNRDLIADQPAAGLQGRVPGEVEILPVHLGLSGEAGRALTPGILGRAVEDRVQHHLAGHALDGEVAD